MGSPFAISAFGSQTGSGSVSMPTFSSVQRPSQAATAFGQDSTFSASSAPASSTTQVAFSSWDTSKTAQTPIP